MSSGSSRRSLRRLIVAVVAGLMVGGGLMAMTPAGAEVSQAAATSWKKIWKKELKPLAVKAFYTKAQSDAKYQPKGSYETAGSGYSKSETYSKAEIDAKLAPFVNSVSASSGGDQNVSLTTEQVVRTVNLVAPANGTVIVSSSAYLVNDGATAATIRCGITTGTTIDFNFLQYSKITDPGDSDAIAGTRGFAVTKGSTLTVNLVCDTFSGTGGVRDSSLTAIFAPS